MFLKIFSDIPSQSLLLFIDAFLNIFYQLNQLVSKYPKNMNGIKRNDIWKLIQCSYSELFKCAAKVFFKKKEKKHHFYNLFNKTRIVTARKFNSIIFFYMCISWLDFRHKSAIYIERMEIKFIILIFLIKIADIIW